MKTWCSSVYEHIILILLWAICELLFVFLILRLSHSEFQNSFTPKKNNMNNILILGCVSPHISQGRSYDDYLSAIYAISISDCFFSRSSMINGDGGVIRILRSSINCSMSVSYSMFYNCLCSQKGGAIHFITSGNYSLKMICANRCTTSNYYGQFAYFEVPNENQIEYLSASSCSNTTTGYSALYLKNGNQCLVNSNISMNSANAYGVIASNYPLCFICSYCTVSNNNVSNKICMYFLSNNGTISYANIVQNNSPNGNGVLFFYGGSSDFQYCTFYQNYNALFSVESATLIMSHCLLSHISVFSSSKATVLTSTNNSIDTLEPLDYRQTYQIQFFISHYCNADNPLPIQTPKKTNEETPMITPDITNMKTLEYTPMNTPHESHKETIHRSYADCVCSCRIAKMRNMNAIFSFSFLYPMVFLLIA